MSVIGLVQSSYHEAVGGTAPKRGNFVLETDIFIIIKYHHAKFHADRCHCRRDICNRTDTEIHKKNYSRFNMRQNVYKRCVCR